MQQNFIAPQKLNHIDTNVSFIRDATINNMIGRVALKKGITLFIAS